MPWFVAGGRCFWPTSQPDGPLRDRGTDRAGTTAGEGLRQVDGIPVYGRVSAGGQQPLKGVFTELIYIGFFGWQFIFFQHLAKEIKRVLIRF